MRLGLRSLKKKIDKCSKAIYTREQELNQMLKKKSKTVALDYFKNMKKYPTLMSDWHCFLKI